MARNKKMDIQVLSSTTKETIKIVNALSNLSEDDIYNIIASRAALSVAEVRFNHLLEGGNPEYCVTPDFEGYKKTLEKYFTNTSVHVNVYDGDGFTTLITADYADIRVAFLNHSEMTLGDIKSSEGRDGICYKTADGYYVEVLGNYVAGTIDKKKK